MCYWCQIVAPNLIPRARHAVNEIEKRQRTALIKLFGVALRFFPPGVKSVVENFVRRFCNSFRIQYVVMRQGAVLRTFLGRVTDFFYRGAINVHMGLLSQCLFQV